MSAEKPWEDYADPLAAPAAPAALAAPDATPAVGQGEDLIKGMAGGLGRGISGAIGLPGTVQGLVRGGLDYLLPPSQKQLDVRKQAPNLLPSAPTVQSAIEDKTGKLYEPQTPLGQYGSTLTEFAVAAPLAGATKAAKVFNTVVPALTSESAGQLTKGTAAEPYARAIGGVAGGVGAGKLVTPAAPAPAAHQRAVQALEAEGIPLTAGQRTGSKPIMWAESTAADTPGSATAARNLYGRGESAFDRAATERVYDRGQLTARGVPPDVNLPDPRVARAGPQSLSDEYTRLHQNDLVANPQLLNRVQAAQTNYDRLVGANNRTQTVAGHYDDIIDKLVAGRGRMAGDEYQALRSNLGFDAKAATTRPSEANALREMKRALDEAMGASLPPRDAAALALTNRRYANMKQIEDAVAASTTGHLSPTRVAQSARAGRGGQYAAQSGDLDELSQAAATVMKSLPQSGTGPRTQMQTLFNLPNMLAGGGGVLGSVMGGPLGALAGAALPLTAARAVVSRPGQAYLGNQALPQNTRDIIAQTLAQQAISQPGVIERNKREREEYERKRKNPLRP